MSERGRVRVGVNGYGAIGKRAADAVLAQSDRALPGVSELVADWRPRGDLYEVALWEDLVSVEGRELHYAYMVDNQAIVIPETVDAVRALSGAEPDPEVSIRKTDEALGVRGGPWD